MFYLFTQSVAPDVVLENPSLPISPTWLMRLSHIGCLLSAPGGTTRCKAQSVSYSSSVHFCSSSPHLHASGPFTPKLISVSLVTFNITHPLSASTLQTPQTCPLASTAYMSPSLPLILPSALALTCPSEAPNALNPRLALSRNLSHLGKLLKPKD